MFLRSLVKLNNSISDWNFAPKFRWRPKKGLCCILVLSQSGILHFFLPSGYYLPKNREGLTYFAPFSARPKRALAPPKSTPMNRCTINVRLALGFELRLVVAWQWCWESTTTDREPTDREQCRLSEKGDPKYIFTIPRAILPKPSLVTKSLRRNHCNEIVASRSVDLARGVDVLYLLCHTLPWPVDHTMPV